MSIKKRKCPFCEREFGKGNPHIYKCKKRPIDKTKDEIKFEFYKFNFPEVSSKEVLFKEHIENNMSLPELREKYELDFKAIQWLMRYFGIKWRTIKEAFPGAHQKSLNYYRKNFNVENCSQIESVKEKKKETFIKHYGVDNIRK